MTGHSGLKSIHLHDVLGAIPGIEPWHSFWYRRPEQSFPPAPIRFPHQLDGSDRLNLSCTQTELKPAEQKKLVQDWCGLLPTRAEIRFLWLCSRVPPELFESVCEMQNLEGLWIKWSGITDLNPIIKLKRLKYLHIGSSPSASPLESLNHLDNLVWLEISNIRAAYDLEFLASMSQLKGLDVSGDTNSAKCLVVKNLLPLAHLSNLEWLSLSCLRSEDESLAAIGNLKNLRWFGVGANFPMEEYARLAAILPDTYCRAFDPVLSEISYNSCSRCGGKTLVLPTGKRKRALCKKCDKLKLQSHVDAFQERTRSAAQIKET